MALKNLVGAVYENDTVPVSDNMGLIFDWELAPNIIKEITFGIDGPELHGIATGWYVKAEAYWLEKNVKSGPVFVRLFIGKGKDLRCLAGQVELPALQKTDRICESTIMLKGIGGINLCETK